MPQEFTKDPEAALDYTWDWASWLQTLETISVATVTVPTGITKVSQSNTTTKATVWLSGGTHDADYTVKCNIVTSQGRTDERSILIKVRQR